MSLKEQSDAYLCSIEKQFNDDYLRKQNKSFASNFVPQHNKVFMNDIVTVFDDYLYRNNILCIDEISKTRGTNNTINQFYENRKQWNTNIWFDSSKSHRTLC